MMEEQESGLLMKMKKMWQHGLTRLKDSPEV
jgi:hypothetical protein